MMRRRRFLGVVGAGAGLLASSGLPTLLRRAFADVSVDGPAGKSSPSSLAEGQRRARSSDKPLLVLIVPADAAQRYERGMAYGELLNHGTAEQLAPLALVEVACATLAELRATVAVPGTGEPLMVLVEEGRAARRLDGVLPTYDWNRMGRGMDRSVDEVRIADQRIARLARLLVETLGDPAMVARTWARIRARLQDPRSDQQLIDQLFGRGSPEEIDRIAPLLWGAIEGAGDRQRGPFEPLASAVIARLRVVPPTGSRWGHATGCGTSYEPTPDELRQRREEDERARAAGLAPPDRISYGVKCGMGHVPAKSARFLDFLVNKTAG